MGLRSSLVFRSGTAVLLAGGLAAGVSMFSTLSVVWGVTIAAAGYLCILAAVYLAGGSIRTRGGIVEKKDAPWTYRTNFIFMSMFGVVPAFIVISRSVMLDQPYATATRYFGTAAMIAFGLLAVSAFAWVSCALVIALVGGAMALFRRLLH